MDHSWGPWTDDEDNDPDNGREEYFRECKRCHGRMTRPGGWLTNDPNPTLTLLCDPDCDISLVHYIMGIMSHHWRQAPEHNVRQYMTWQCVHCLAVVESDTEPSPDHHVALWEGDPALAIFFKLPGGNCDELIVYRIMMS